MKLLDLFSGIGGFSLGLERAGFETIAFCEIEEYPQKVLAKHWPDIPCAQDVTKLTYKDGVLYDDGREIYRGAIDAICGGFPCQDLSKAGLRKGFNGERSSLYTHMLRIISECLPEVAIFENVTELLNGESGRLFAQFLYDLAAVGYDAEWHCISASAIGKAHHRDRVWIIAYPNSTMRKGLDFPKPLLAYTEESRRREYTRAVDATLPADDYTKLRPGLNGVSGEVGRTRGQLKAYGNAVVPEIPEIIGRAIMNDQVIAVLEDKNDE